jgi:hypothetical protein
MWCIYKLGYYSYGLYETSTTFHMTYKTCILFSYSEWNLYAIKNAVFWDVTMSVSCKNRRPQTLHSINWLGSLAKTLCVSSYMELFSYTRRRHSSQPPPWKPQTLYLYAILLLCCAVHNWYTIPAENKELASWRIVSSGMLRRVALVKTHVSEEACRLLVTPSVVSSSPILVTLMK